MRPVFSRNWAGEDGDLYARATKQGVVNRWPLEQSMVQDAQLPLLPCKVAKKNGRSLRGDDEACVPNQGNLFGKGQFFRKRDDEAVGRGNGTNFRLV